MLKLSFNYSFYYISSAHEVLFEALVVVRVPAKMLLHLLTN